MKTDGTTSGVSGGLKNPYVLLERFDGYRQPSHNNSISRMHREGNGGPDADFMPFDWSQIMGIDNSGTKLFNSYVLLERLSVDDVQNLLNKSN